ncbi:Unknown protein sequence [Pseudomonas syringae pv. maculicola]|uniref:Uncharacterized protein n=1 Tax=Pseudomonas syringae pv. maculicola TaxID=59511 RepID=A0A3M2Y7M2_PSEYM|nr:Unknown protein sequence [Pseudomonas syringae pv. maculicola]KPC08650.1 Unknown protein sequence [Pseudomonas syringae pv. maculicola str. M6]RML71458.1 hypothetical protein APX70_100207 [Pseudomonas syringae pv. maculicola]
MGNLAATGVTRQAHAATHNKKIADYRMLLSLLEFYPVTYQ